MADPSQLKTLKRGTKAWNDWRQKTQNTDQVFDEADLQGADLKYVYLAKVDLREANLEGANLKGAGLRGAYLQKTYLTEANLREADLRKANLREAFLERANLDEADLEEADLTGADLTKADLREANLQKANLRQANLKGADLEEAFLDGAYLEMADLREANLRGANLSNTLLSEITLGDTVLANLILENVEGLDRIHHTGPSHISTYTIQRAQGNLPEVFLRGCGLSDLDIEQTKLYNPDLSNREINDIVYKIYDLRAKRSIQVSPLFISYSQADSKFVDMIESQLDQLGVRFWRDVHHAIAGPLEKQIDRAIRYNPTVLLILSKNSIKSDWVQHEVRTARELEKEKERHVICPVALDDSWKSSSWPKRIMEQVMEYNILDFSKWEDKAEFKKQFKKLIDGLDLFYK